MKNRLAITLVALLGLSACGQKGSLYIVGPNGEKLSQQAARDLEKEAEAEASGEVDAAAEDDGESSSTQSAD